MLANKVLGRGMYCLTRCRGGGHFAYQSGGEGHTYPTKVVRSGHIAYQGGGEGDYQGG